MCCTMRNPDLTGVHNKAISICNQLDCQKNSQMPIFLLMRITVIGSMANVRITVCGQRKAS